MKRTLQTTFALATLLLVLPVASAGIGFFQDAVYVKSNSLSSDVFVGCWQAASHEAPRSTCGVTSKTLGTGGPIITYDVYESRDCIGGRVNGNMPLSPTCVSWPQTCTVAACVRGHQVYTLRTADSDVTISLCRQESYHAQSCGVASRVAGMGGPLVVFERKASQDCLHTRVILSVGFPTCTKAPQGDILPFP